MEMNFFLQSKAGLNTMSLKNRRYQALPCAAYLYPFFEVAYDVLCPS